MGLKRKFRRKNIIKERKDANKELAAKIASFENIPDKCLTCGDSFDRLNKQQVKTWRVIVKQQKNVVRLYCPDCWDKAIAVVQKNV